MALVTCKESRELLQAVAAGGPASASPAWTELLGRNAVEGSPDRPQITAIGRHVLAELELRGYRCDPWPLDQLAEELSRVPASIETTARDAEYFLTDLGPITPPEALPYLRIVSVGLANRRETAEDLAERFRQVWGMVEVMGGDARDRLVGAELLLASSAPMSQIYAPMMNLVETLRGYGATRAVAPAALLLLEPEGSPPAAAERWRAARAQMPTDESAAMLATVLPDPRRSHAFEAFRDLFGAVPDLQGRSSAALYLASQSIDPSKGIERIVETARLLGEHTRRPLLSASLLTSEHPLSPAELVDWVDRAAEAATRSHLASQPEEFQTLGIAIVEGLPRTTFVGAETTSSDDRGKLAEAATLLALHAWLYRPILDPAFESEFARTPATETR